jgi:hypothetical protein
MKSDHRHELKTNELAEWLGNLPQWAKENVAIIIVVLAVIAGAAAFYIWKGRTKSEEVNKQLAFTALLYQVPRAKDQIIAAQAQGADRSFMLFKPADNLRAFAEGTDDDNMAAFALIKRAEALRMELHYRLGTVRGRDFAAQITKAEESYTAAIEKSSSNPSFMAAAKFGLGLCAEELGNFDKAQQIYRDITDDPNFEGTITVAQAKQRLDTMDDYREKVVFRPAPKPVTPPVQLKPADTNLPADANSPADANLPVVPDLPADVNRPIDTNLPVVPDLPADINRPADTNMSPQAPGGEPNTAPDVSAPRAPGGDANIAPQAPGGEPNTLSKTPDVNAPAQSTGHLPVDSNSIPGATAPRAPGGDANVSSK